MTHEIKFSAHMAPLLILSAIADSVTQTDPPIPEEKQSTFTTVMSSMDYVLNNESRKDDWCKHLVMWLDQLYSMGRDPETMKQIYLSQSDGRPEVHDRTLAILEGYKGIWKVAETVYGIKAKAPIKIVNWVDDRTGHTGRGFKLYVNKSDLTSVKIEQGEHLYDLGCLRPSSGEEDPMAMD
jgi:hypothetical protein